jgi:hypothetical protein
MDGTAFVFGTVIGFALVGSAIREGLKAIARAIEEAARLREEQRAILRRHIADLERCAKEFDAVKMKESAAECRQAVKELEGLL